MSKTYRKKPLEVQAWEFPDTHNKQGEIKKQLNDAGIQTHLYDYAVETSETPFEDGAYWRWTAVHVERDGKKLIAFIGDVIALDPAEGLRVISPQVFAATHEQMQP